MSLRPCEQKLAQCLNYSLKQVQETREGDLLELIHSPYGNSGNLLVTKFFQGNLHYIDINRYNRDCDNNYVKCMFETMKPKGEN